MNIFMPHGGPKPFLNLYEGAGYARTIGLFDRVQAAEQERAGFSNESLYKPPPLEPKS